MKYLNNSIRTIFILLGSDCNFSCRYCMQNTASAKIEPLSTEINEDIYEFINEIADNQKDILTIQFYGGEPLLYFDNIKKIVKNTCNAKNIVYNFISNGSLITDEMVEFFNDNNFNETISWDGASSILTRQSDVFNDNKQLLFKLNRLGVSGVYSSYTYPAQLLNDYQKLSDEYYAIHNYHLHINIDELFDTGMTDRSLFDIDYNRVSNDIDIISKKIINYRMGKSNTDITYMENAYISNIIGAIVNFTQNNKDIIDNMVHCGNGYSVYNLDLEGNLYSCHNRYDKCGDIYSNYKSYLNKIIEFDDTKNNKETCKQCDIYPICMGGCKLIDKSTRTNTYCILKKAVYLPIIKNILELNKGVKHNG